MPVAGDEGYERMFICPYDKSHEVRAGRMQFHIKKCRENHQSEADKKEQCPFNTAHIIPKVEMAYHMAEDCTSRANYERGILEVGSADCPVKELVAVNAATVPDGDENWDDFEASGSVLSTIKTTAAEKGIVRMLQCESKAKRKNFRKQERVRHQQFQKDSEGKITESTSSYLPANQPSVRPTKIPSAPAVRQNLSEAAATYSLDIDCKMDQLKLDEKPFIGVSLISAPSQATTSNGSEKTGTYASVSARPSTAMSSALSMNSRQSSRPSTAMSIEASVRKVSVADSIESYTTLVSDEGNFCQVPIPGIGRGAAARRNKHK